MVTTTAPPLEEAPPRRTYLKTEAVWVRVSEHESGEPCLVHVLRKDGDEMECLAVVTIKDGTALISLPDDAELPLFSIGRIDDRPCLVLHAMDGGPQAIYTPAGIPERLPTAPESVDGLD